MYVHLNLLGAGVGDVYGHFQLSEALQWGQKGKVPCNQQNISFICIPKSGVVVVVEVVVINVVVVVVVVVVRGLVEVVVVVEVVVINVVVVLLVVVVDFDVDSGFVVVLSAAVTVDVTNSDVFGALLTTITDVTMTER